MTPAQLRIAKDMADLEIPSNVELRKTDDYNLSFIISPDSGHWKGGQFEFKFQFPSKYPFQGPKVTCMDPIYHPNIDLEGAPCVNVLRPWKPTYSTQIVLFGLLFLFTHPNASDPLNQEAAKEMRENPAQFAKNVVNALKGLRVGGTQFPKNKGKVSGAHAVAVLPEDETHALARMACADSHDLLCVCCCWPPGTLRAGLRWSTALGHLAPPTSLAARSLLPSHLTCFYTLCATQFSA